MHERSSRSLVDEVLRPVKFGRAFRLKNRGVPPVSTFVWQEDSPCFIVNEFFSKKCIPVMKNAPRSARSFLDERESGQLAPHFVGVMRRSDLESFACRFDGNPLLTKILVAVVTGSLKCTKRALNGRTAVTEKVSSHRENDWRCSGVGPCTLISSQIF